MPDENKVNALINIGAGKIASKVYDDAFGQALKKVGVALGTVVDIANTALLPVQWMHDRAKLYFEQNLTAYQKRLETIPEENVIPVASEIAAPILERFGYVSNSILAEAFVNLLATASDARFVEFAHPALIAILDRISPDEAKMLQSFANSGFVHFPAIRSYAQRRGSDRHYLTSPSFFTGIEFEVDLTFSNSLPFYFDNLIALGLLNHGSETLLIIPEYERLEKRYKAQLDEFDKHVSTKSGGYYRANWIREHISLQRLGRVFCRACCNMIITENDQQTPDFMG